MATWKDDKRAAEALSGNVVIPQSNYRAYALAGGAVILAVLAAVVLLRPKPPGLTIAPSAAVPAVQASEEPSPVAAAVAVARNGSAETAKVEVVVLPPVTLREKSPAKATPSAARAAGTKAPCPEGELEPADGTRASKEAAIVLAAARLAEEAASGDIVALEQVRKQYQQALDSGNLSEKDEAVCLEKLTALTNKIVLDPKVACAAPAAVLHKVEPGDGVEKLARKYKVNQGQIKRINKLNDKLTIRYGQTLKILPGDVCYTVSRSRLTGTLSIDGVFVRRYPIGIGPGNATPVGAYTVERKVVNPDWYADSKRIPFGDPVNILGTRWMALTAADGTSTGDGLGIHGTTKPETVPGRESKGCVRMINSEVEELYDLMPQGGKVLIVE